MDNCFGGKWQSIIFLVQNLTSEISEQSSVQLPGVGNWLDHFMVHGGVEGSEKGQVMPAELLEENEEQTRSNAS